MMTAVLIAMLGAAATPTAGAALDIGSRRELLVDSWLIESMDGVALRLNSPTPREISIVFDEPWEGNVSTYVTVFQDGDLFRMYYRGAHYDVATKTTAHPEVVCYAESDDGIVWRKPRLGLVEF